jgi:two-component system LytT family response regulator
MRTSALVAERRHEVRARLVEVLQELNLFQDVAECDNGRSAVETIRSSCPDLLVIDTRLNGMDGFAVLEAVLDEPLGLVVMVTDDDRSTVHALGEHGIPYLRRPIDIEDARSVFERCRGARASSDPGLSHRLVAVLETLGRRRSHSDRLLVKDGRQMVIVDVDEIHWIESAGNYVRLHLGDEVHTMRSTLAGLERRLDPGQFLRIHRSIIVNVDQVKQITPWNHSDSAVVLRDGTRLNLSRGYRAGVERFLERYSA